MKSINYGIKLEIGNTRKSGKSRSTWKSKPFPKTGNSKSESNWKLNAKQQHFGVETKTRFIDATHLDRELGEIPLEPSGKNAP